MPRRARGTERWTLLSRAAAAGFTLLELLVTAFIFGVLGLTVVHFFTSQTKFRSDTDAQAETHQGLVAALDSLTRDIRLAGVCLPSQPTFVPMGPAIDQTTGGFATDSITMRIGVLTSTTTCPGGSLTANAASGASTLNVSMVDGFVVNGRGFIGNNSTNQYFRVTAVSGTSGAGTVTITPALTAAYTGCSPQPCASATAVHPFEERTYTIDPTTYGAPALTLQINQGLPNPTMALAVGIESLNIQYRLSQNCPPPSGNVCTLINQPTTAQWSLVSQAIVTLGGRSIRTLTTRTSAAPVYYRETATVTIQPRNFLNLRTG